MAEPHDAPSPDPGLTSDPARSALRLPKAPRVKPPTLGDREDSSELDENSETEITKEDLVTWARIYEPDIEELPVEQAKSEIHRAHIPRDQRKFHKFDPAAAKAEQLAAEAAEADPAGERGEVLHLHGRGVSEDYLRGGLGVAEDPRKALRRLKLRRHSPFSRLRDLAIVGLLMMASFCLGRATRHVIPAAPPAPAGTPGPSPAGNLPVTLTPLASPAPQSPSPAATR